MTNPPDDRSPLAQALAWSSRITAVSLEMVLPGALGYWIDRKLGTGLVFLVVGVAAGMAGGLTHLIRMTSDAGPQSDGREDSSDGGSERERE